MRKIFEVILFVVIYILAMYLIENEGHSFIVELAGDMFGSLGLVLLGIFTFSED